VAVPVNGPFAFYTLTRTLPKVLLGSQLLAETICYICGRITITEQ
jgi:hypothetical protein